MKLTLVVPGLFGTETFDFGRKAALKELRLTNLQRIAARGTCQSVASEDFLDLITSLFGVANSRVSLASVTRFYDSPSSESSNWLRADPVHLLAGPRNLSLIDARQLDIGAEEAGEFVEQINAISDGTWEIDAPHPERWYIKTNQRLNLKTHPLALVAGYEIGNHLPTGDDCQYWISLVNEIQMLLYQLPVNQNRVARGKRPINSIWLWGEGEVTIPPDPKWTKVWSDEEVAMGFAHLTKVPYAALPSNSETCFNEFQNNGNYLLVFSNGYYQVQYGLSDWEVLAQTFDQSWLGSLISGLTNSQLKELTLIVPKQFRLQLSNHQLSRLWLLKRAANHIIKYINKNT